MRWFDAIAATLALASGAAQAHTPTPVAGPFEISFECPQATGTRLSRGVPVNAQFSFEARFDGEPTLQWKGWRDLMEGLAEGRVESQVDPFACIQKLERQVESALISKCMGTAVADQCRDSIVPTLLAPLQLIHARIGKRMLESDAFPTFPPGVRYKDLGGVFVEKGGIPAREINAERAALRTCSVQNDAVALSEDFIDQELGSVLSEVSDPCRGSILRSYLEHAAALEPSPERCPVVSRDPDCARFRDTTRRFLQKLGRHLPPDPAAGALSTNPLSQCVDASQDLSALLSQLSHDVSSAFMCKQLQIGESSTVDVPDVGSGLGAHYRLKRGSEHEYLAELNLRFPPALQAEQVQKANGCLQRYESTLKGKGGDRLKIRVNDSPGSGIPAVKVDMVVVAEGDRFRENAELWGTQSTCETIVHEILHHMGLVDEYPETEIGYRYDPVSGRMQKVQWLRTEAAGTSSFVSSDCRFVGPPNSPMRTTNFHWVQGVQVFGTCTCDSRLSEPDCGRALKRLETEGLVKSGAGNMDCPPDAPGSINERSGAISNEDWAEFDRLPVGRQGRSYSVRGAMRPASDALLLPAQFRALIQPGCSRVNGTYYRCARAAYQTSIAHLGGGCPKGTPDVCTKPEEWTQ